MRTIQLPADLCAAVEKTVGHRFGSLEELLVRILSDLANNEAEKSDIAEQKLVEERLKDLGYL